MLLVSLASPRLVTTGQHAQRYLGARSRQAQTTAGSQSRSRQAELSSSAARAKNAATTAMDEHGPGGECRRLKQSIILRPIPALGIAAILIFLLTTALHTPSTVQDGPVTEHVIQGVVKSAVVEEVAAMRAQATRGGATGYPPVKKLHSTKKLRVLITGGAGFVGSNLVDKLMREGHEVTVLDNLVYGTEKNIEHWLGHPNFNLVIGDVVEPVMLEVDQIYHLACPASPPHYQYNPIKTIKTSTEGTLNMLGLAKRVSARMLLTSTSEVYGDPEVHPQPETYWGHVNPIGPRACYDEGKRVAETMMYSYKSQANVKVRVARIFNTFGPRMHPNDGRVVSNFIIQALQGKDITIYGEGEQTRSFQYVSDLIDCLHRLMNGDYDQPVNCGNPEEFTVKSFAESVRELVKSNSTIVNLPATEDDPRQRKPDITVAREHLGWAPRWHVRDGLERTVKYFANELARSGGVIIPTGPGAAKPKPKEDE